MRDEIFMVCLGFMLGVFLTCLAFWAFRPKLADVVYNGEERRVVTIHDSDKERVYLIDKAEVYYESSAKRMVVKMKGN